MVGKTIMASRTGKVACRSRDRFPMIRGRLSPRQNTLRSNKSLLDRAAHTTNSERYQENLAQNITRLSQVLHREAQVANRCANRRKSDGRVPGNAARHRVRLENFGDIQVPAQSDLHGSGKRNIVSYVDW